MLTRTSFTPLVTLDQVKAHLRIGEEEREDDALIEGLIQTAGTHIDGPRGILGRCIAVQTWSLTLPQISAPVRLPIPFIAEVSAVGLDDDLPVHLCRVQSGIWTEVAPAGAASSPLRLDMTPAAPEDLWPVVVTAIKLLVGHWYLNREAVITGTITSTLPISVDRLLAPLKVHWV